MSSTLLSSRWLGRLLSEGATPSLLPVGALRTALLPSLLHQLEQPAAAQAQAQARLDRRPHSTDSLLMPRVHAALPLAVDFLLAPTHSFGVDERGELALEDVNTQLTAALQLVLVLSPLGGALKELPRSRLLCRTLHRPR